MSHAMPCSATAAELAHDRAYRDQADPEPFMDQAREEVFDHLMTKGYVPECNFTLATWIDCWMDANHNQVSEQAAQLIIADHENNNEAKQAVLSDIKDKLREYLKTAEVVTDYAERIANENASERERDERFEADRARYYGSDA